MFSQVNTQDLLLQNQSMRLVEESLDASNQHAVALAKVRYLQSVLPTPIVGTAGVVVMFYLLGISLNRPVDMLVWLLLGSFATAWRIVLFFRHKDIFVQTPNSQTLSRYLTQTTLTAVIAGMTFGWGWLNIYTYLSPEIQMGFLFTNIVMLFGGLYAYSPHLPAYLSFSLFSLAPALWQVQQNSTLWIAQTVGITLVVLVSQMFAFRWAQNFRHNVLLQDNNAKLLAELTEKKDLAEKATRAKSRFLASVSHDLRQPLHAINLYLAVLKRSLEPTDSSRLTESDRHDITHTHVHHLQDSATQLTLMFEALLNISKLDAGTVQPNIAPIKIGNMIKHLAQEYAQVAEHAGLAFETFFPEEIDQMEVVADSIMLERILRNLLTNATSHTQTGAVRLRLKVKKSGEPGRLEFRIVDTGPGIKASDRERIFEEFYQTDIARKRLISSQKTSQNLGLGLAISARLAQLLNTRISLHSYPEKGSVFAFDLPLQYAVQSSRDETLDDLKEPSHDTGSLHHVCVAVIDNDTSILNATQKLLQSYGANVLTAQSAAQIWLAVQASHTVPDIFLVDHGLDEEFGTDLIQTIHEKYGADKPCILITGDSSAEHVEKFNQAKLLVLYKPLTDQTLLQAIHDKLGRDKKSA